MDEGKGKKGWIGPAASAPGMANGDGNDPSLLSMDRTNILTSTLREPSVRQGSVNDSASGAVAGSSSAPDIKSPSRRAYSSTVC